MDRLLYWLSRSRYASSLAEYLLAGLVAAGTALLVVIALTAFGRPPQELAELEWLRYSTLAAAFGLALSARSAFRAAVKARVSTPATYFFGTQQIQLIPAIAPHTLAIFSVSLVVSGASNLPLREPQPAATSCACEVQMERVNGVL